MNERYRGGQDVKAPAERRITEVPGAAQALENLFAQHIRDKAPVGNREVYLDGKNIVIHARLIEDTIKNLVWPLIEDGEAIRLDEHIIMADYLPQLEAYCQSQGYTLHHNPMHLLPNYTLIPIKQPDQEAISQE